MVLDGNFETELSHFVSPVGQDDKTFSLKALTNNRFAVFNTHLAYLRAGAQIIRTNTYRATQHTIRHHLNVSTSDSMSIITQAVVLGHMALMKHYEETGGHCSNTAGFHQSRALLAGTCGSYRVSCFDKISGCTEEANSDSTRFLFAFHKMRVDKFLKGPLKVDLLAFESISSLKEMEAIVQTLKLYPTARAWITFLCMENGRLLDGTTFKMAATSFYYELTQQCVAIGVECSSPDSMKPVMESLYVNRVPTIPYMFYIDKWYLPVRLVSFYGPAGASALLEHNFVQEWFDIGVRYFGGGKDTTADDITKIRANVNDYFMNHAVIFNVLRPLSYKKNDKISKL